MSSKYVFQRTRIEKRQNYVTSLAMLFIYGIYGTVCLLITTICGQGLFNMSVSTIFTVILAGIFLHTALSLNMIAIAIGNAGIATSIFSSCCGIQAAGAYFFLHQ